MSTFASQSQLPPCSNAIPLQRLSALPGFWRNKNAARLVAVAVRLLLAALGVAAMASMSPAIGDTSSGAQQLPQHPIVYTRVPRTQGSLQWVASDGTTQNLSTPDIWDRLPDTRNIVDGFNAPGQLILRYPGGVEEVIYDCFTQANPCVPLDPAVSLDGTAILFSVYEGKSLRQRRWRGADLPNETLDGAFQARLYRYDVKTRSLVPLAHEAGTFDVSPAWLPDGRIMFGSSRASFVKPYLDRIGHNRRPNFQLFVASASGTNAINVSPHEVTTALHPYVLSSGRVAYGSHWLSHNLPYFYNNSGINWPATLDNVWAVMGSDYRGGDMQALLGAHRFPFKDAGGRTKTMKALHFLGERDNGDVCVANYYRGNNLGLGDILCWTPEAKGIEGELPHFLPSNLYSVANWSKSNDEASLRKDGIFQGKVGYPEGLPNNQLMLTLGDGFCTQVGGSVNSFLAKSLAEQPEVKACDVGVYVTSRIPSQTMSDMTSIVDRPQWHEFGARLVSPRAVARPALSKTPDGSCQLASSNAYSSETGAIRPYRFNKNFKTSANNGGEIDSSAANEMTGMRFWAVLPNRPDAAPVKTVVGNRLRLLGDAPLLADGSFRVRLPCNMPFVMGGIDEEGRVVKRDQVPQSLRWSELRTCTGCHLHSQSGRPFENSLASTAPPVDLRTPLPVPRFGRDIRPIFEAHCTGCHERDVPLFNYHALVWDFLQEKVPAAKRHQVQDSENERRRYGLQRPYTSKYVNSRFARESMLYWKAANERTDGRRDDTFPDDIDFGSAHPTTLSEAELAKIALWLDSGAHP